MCVLCLLQTHTRTGASGSSCTCQMNYKQGKPLVVESKCNKLNKIKLNNNKLMCL